MCRSAVVLRVISRFKIDLLADIVAFVILGGAPLADAICHVIMAESLQLIIGWAGQQDANVTLNLLCG
jgi:hypothetical protein